jgi:hypothetical protein
VVHSESGLQTVPAREQDPDDIIPVEHARELYRVADGSEYVEIESCGHDDRPMTWADIEAFVDDRGLLPGVPRASGRGR